MTRSFPLAQAATLILLCGIMACSPLPDTGADATATQVSAPSAEAKLVPVDDILADADAFAQDGVAVGSLEARMAALRARAADLRRQ